jgi:phosphatidylinositol alpha-1,6-mannosyltransferase
MSEADAPVALLITRNFPPLTGGMELLNAHLLRELAPDWQPALCGPAGSGAFVERGVPVVEHTIRPLASFLLRTLGSALAFARRRRPRCVIGGSGLVAPLVWLVARSCRARAVLYLHGLDLVAAHRIYQAVWVPWMRRADLVLVNSANTRRLAIERGIRAERVIILHPGTDVPGADRDARDAERARRGWGQRRLLLSVGRFTRRKGLAEFVEQALPLIVAQHRDLLLVVIGEEAVDALSGSGGGERERILAAAARSGVESNLVLLGRCGEEDLRAAYRAADCHVFPVLDLPGDVEGFGMVALEAAAHGVPTVAFAVGGVPDAVRDGLTGRLVEAADYAQFAQATLDVLATAGAERWHASCLAFASEKSWPRFGHHLRAALARNLG